MIKSNWLIKHQESCTTSISKPRLFFYFFLASNSRAPFVFIISYGYNITYGIMEILYVVCYVYIMYLDISSKVSVYSYNGCPTLSFHKIPNSTKLHSISHSILKRCYFFLLITPLYTHTPCPILPYRFSNATVIAIFNLTDDNLLNNPQRV